MGTKSSIEKLNSFLRGEMAAVETYEIALKKIDEISTARDELLVNLKSHSDRVMELQEFILAAGGTPATSSGPWGVFAKTVEESAKVMGDKAAVAALEQGEDHGEKDYNEDIDDLDPEARQFVMNRLIPEQHKTHERLSELKHRLS